MELKQAVIEGAKIRFRPELLSAAVGSLALVPLLLSTGTGAEIEKPLAAVVIGGLLARPLSIVVLPVFYHWVEMSRAIPGGMATSNITGQRT